MRRLAQAEMGRKRYEEEEDVSARDEMRESDVLQGERSLELVLILVGEKSHVLGTERSSKLVLSLKACPARSRRLRD